MRFLILLAVLVLPFNAMAVDYQHSTTAQDITFSWSVDGDKLHIKLSAKTTGWIGIGFNSSSAMKDATFFIGRAREDKAKVSTHFGTSSYAHSEADDAAQATDVTGKEADGVTEIEFTVPLSFDNSKYKPIEATKETTILLAYAVQDGTTAQHRINTKLSVNLSTGTVKALE